MLLNFLSNLYIPLWFGKLFEVMVFRLPENALPSQKFNLDIFTYAFLPKVKLFPRFWSLSPWQKEITYSRQTAFFRKSFSLSRRGREIYRNGSFNPFSANFTKWSNSLKQFAGNLPTNCLSVFDHFVELALTGLIIFTNISSTLDKVYSKLVKSTLTKDFEQSK